MALIFVAALAAYARSFAAPFQFDDVDQIVGNPAVEAPTLTGLLQWARTRVIPFATLAFNHRLGGEATFGYHVVNFAVHVINAFLLFGLAWALCDAPRLRGTWLREQRLILATAAALLFACHPIQVEAVTYIVQRTTSMAAMFYLSSVFFYVSGRNARSAVGRRAGYAAALICAGAAFVSKENAATLPLAIALTEIVFYSGFTRRALVRLAPFAGLVLVIPLAWLWLWPVSGPQTVSLTGRVATLARRMTISVDAAGRTSPGQYFLTQCVVVPRYLRLVAIPHGFTVDHDMPVARGWSLPVALGLAVLSALVLTGIAAAARWPLVGYGVLWMLLTLSVESSFLPIADVMVEHRMYLPMAGLALVIGTAFAWAFMRAPAPAVIGGGLVVVLLIALTMARNEVWRSPESLWREAVARSPGKARAHLNLATVLHQAGRLEEAVPEYCRTLDLEPNNTLAHSNLRILTNQRLTAQLDNAADGEEIDLTVEAENPNVKILTATDPCKRN